MIHNTSMAPLSAASIRALHVVALVVGDLHGELARGLRHTDSNVHGRDGSRVGGPIGTDGDGGIGGVRVIDATAASSDAGGCARRSARAVVIVAFDGVQPLDITGPHEVFAGANEALAHMSPAAPRYRLQVVSVDGGEVVAESGLRLGADALSAAPNGSFDVLLLPGGSGVGAACDDPRLVDYIARAAPRARRVVTVCSGTFLAAAAGLLDGRRVTTHWARAKELRARYPAIDVDPDPIFVRDGNVWTSAGVTAGIDLALALVEDDHGVDVAQLVARWLVMFLRRPGGQTQFATPVWNDRPPPGPIRAAQESIEADPAAITASSCSPSGSG